MVAAGTRRVERDRGGSEQLLEAAEALFGRYGIDGVAMRQIQLAAGSSNNFAVQYHFGGIPGLVEAILTKRVPAVDARQAELLRAVEAEDRVQDVRALVAAFFRPLIDATNIAGERSYARFISALLRSAEGERHCRALFHLTPTTARIMALLHRALPELPHGILEERLRLLVGMACTSIFNRVSAVQTAAADEALIEDALDVAAAGLAAPYGAPHHPSR